MLAVASLQVEKTCRAVNGGVKAMTYKHRLTRSVFSCAQLSSIRFSSTLPLPSWTSKLSWSSSLARYLPKFRFNRNFKAFFRTRSEIVARNPIIGTAIGVCRNEDAAGHFRPGTSSQKESGLRLAAWFRHNRSGWSQKGMRGRVSNLLTTCADPCCMSGMTASRAS